MSPQTPLRQKAFTLIEVLIVVGLVGVIAIMMISIVVNQAGEKNFTLKTKSMAQQISNAAGTYAQANPTTTTPPSANLADLMGYSAKVTTGTLVTATPALTCAVATPCYRFSDKSVLVALTSTTVGDTNTYFAFDPDGTGSKSTVILVYQHSTSRITTRAAYMADGGVMGAGIPTLSDPSYVKEWTKL